MRKSSKTYTNGEEKFTTHYALFPTQFEVIGVSGYHNSKTIKYVWIWLEHYTVVQRFVFIAETKDAFWTEPKLVEK